jgi:hypothetical protein
MLKPSSRPSDSDLQYEAIMNSQKGYSLALEMMLESRPILRSPTAFDSRTRITGAVKGGWINVLNVLEKRNLCRIPHGKKGSELLLLACRDQGKKKEKKEEDKRYLDRMEAERLIPHSDRKLLRTETTVQDFPAVMSFLIHKGLDVDYADGPRMDSVLHVAALHGTPKMTALLLGAGADLHCVNNSNQTPLHTAAINNNWQAVVMLLHGGADVFALDSSQRTPLEHALHHDINPSSVLHWLGSVYATRSILLLTVVGQHLDNLKRDRTEAFISSMQQRSYMEPELIKLMLRDTESSIHISIENIDLRRIVRDVTNVHATYI